MAAKRGKKRRLDSAVAAIQARWGPRVLQRGRATLPQTTASAIPTGFPTLDAILGVGGIPRGRITEILGPPTSGKLTLAARLIANAQTRRETAAYVDLSQTFDPDYATRCAVNLKKLIIVRPGNGREALTLTHALVASHGVGLIVFDSVSDLIAEPHAPHVLAEALRQLVGSLARSPCALIFVTTLFFGGPDAAANYPGSFTLSHYATLRLWIETERWHTRHGDTRGYSARVTVLKNKLAPAHKSAQIRITFNGVVDGNGT